MHIRTNTPIYTTFPYSPLAKQGDMGKVPQFFGGGGWGWGPLKVGEVLLKKIEARMVPGIVQVYSAVVYSSKDDLNTNC